MGPANRQGQLDGPNLSDQLSPVRLHEIRTFFSGRDGPGSTKHMQLRIYADVAQPLAECHRRSGSGVAGAAPSR
jgi:hypothetical protein